MFRLAHISDVHMGPLPDVTYRELASKRVVGYVNWKRNRARIMTDGALSTIVEAVRSENADHLAVTGDLVNLALDAELHIAKTWLNGLGAPENVSLVPGNHDAYVPGAFDKACHLWAGWMRGDDYEGPISRHSFPYVRQRGNVALIGVSTARATAPFMANGFFYEAQAARLAKILEEAAARGLFRLVMLHHPPVRAAVPQHKRLFGIGNFQKVMRKHGAELVLHGHSHLPTLYWLEGRQRPVPVVGVAAAGQAHDGRHVAAQYNLLTIAGEPTDWRIHLARKGLNKDHAVSEIMSVDLNDPASTPAPKEGVTA